MKRKEVGKFIQLRPPSQILFNQKEMVEYLEEEIYDSWQLDWEEATGEEIDWMKSLIPEVPRDRNEIFPQNFYLAQAISGIGWLLWVIPDEDWKKIVVNLQMRHGGGKPSSCFQEMSAVQRRKAGQPN